MNAAELLTQPLWQAASLGRPLPDTPHAVSVSLPRWRDVVGYEEKHPEVMRQLTLGYPRFVIHPWVQDIARQLGGGRPCLPWPSRAVAEAGAAYVTKSTGAPTELVPRGGLVGIVTTEEGAKALREFWQHTGWIVSSRQAESWLNGRPDRADAADQRAALRRELAGFYGCAIDDVFLTPTGMAAQHTALRALQTRRPGQPTAQLGFPYVDTLKLQQKLGAGGILLHDLGTAAADLHRLLPRQALAGVFGEIPGNPLLGSADVRHITPVLRQYGVPLVADDVVATPANVDLTSHADLIVTSLTKYIVGTADAMGGAVICSARSPYHTELKSILQAQHEEILWGEDAAVLASQARGFPERMRRHNANGLFIAEKLWHHPAVEQVWYPKWESAEAYEAVRRPEGGYGALITFLPRRAARRSPEIFDRLPVCKGPSLGTIFTLACPFTLLAHYTELDWAESCGVSRHLIRLSVGLEEPEALWRGLDVALRDP